MELDFYIPELSIGFEYQGEQHYRVLGASGDSVEPLDLQRNRDQQKKEQCQKLGITLIAVPYWWDGKAESLWATILQYRQDITTPQDINGHLYKPIPLAPPVLKHQTLQ